MADDFLHLDHLYFNDIGGSDYSASLPIQTIPKSKKGKKWKRNMMDRIEEIGVYQVSKNLSLRDYRKMYEGRLVYQDLEDTAATVQDIADFRRREADIPTYIKHFDIIGIIVNQLSGEYDNQKDGIRVDSLDGFSQNEYFREKNALISKYVEEYFTYEIERGLILMGVDPHEENFNSEEERMQYAQMLQEKQNRLVPPDKLEENLSKDFKTVIAEWAELTLEADFIKYDIEDMDLEELVDYLLTGRYFRHYHIGHDFYRPERWTPETTFFSQELDIVHPQDGEYAGRLTFMSGAEVLQRYGDRLPKKTLEKLYGYSVQATPTEGVTFKSSLSRHFGDTQIVPYKSYYRHDLAYKMQSALGVPMGEEYRNNADGEQTSRPVWLEDTDRYSFIGNRFAQYLRDDIDVRTDVIQVTEAYWRSAKLYGLLTIENDITEEPYQVEVEEDLLKDFIADNNIKELKTISLKEAKEKKEINTIAWFYVPQVWKGKKLNAGNSNLIDDVIFDVEPLPFQIRGDSNLFDVKLPIAGIITSGIAQKIRPYQVKHNLAMNLIENALEKHIGTFFMFDFNFLPTQYKNEIGETTKELIESWREDLRDIGFGFYDASPQNTGGQNPNAISPQAHRVSFVEDVQYYIQLAEMYKTQAYEQIGVTRSRLGNPSEYETEQGIQQGVNASYAQTERIYKRFNTAKRKERELHLTVAQYCVKDNKDIVVDYTRPDGVRILKKFTDENFWLRKINIIPINDSAQRRSLENFRSVLLNNNTMNSDLLDYAKLFTSDSFVTLMNHAEESRRRNDRQIAEQRQHEQTMLDKQLQSAALQDDKNKAYDSRENQLDRENEIRKAEINAVAKIADNNLDTDFISEIERISESNLKEEETNRKLNIQEREIGRKEVKDDKELELALKKLQLEDRKLKEARNQRRNDRYIATINKN